MRTSIPLQMVTVLSLLAGIHVATVRHLTADDGAHRTDVDSRQPSHESVQLKREETDFRLVLVSGRIIDVGKIFAEHQEVIEDALGRKLRSKKPALLRINYEGSNRPMLLASRRGNQLDGPFASYTDDGSPVALVSYKKGKRDSALLTWDDTGRPIVFAQYQSGELHGIRCLFRACCEECKSGHLWMVQEWDQGQLQVAHVVDAEGSTQSFESRYGTPSQPSAGLDSATAELARFESQFDTDQVKLKQLLQHYYAQERRAAALRSSLVASAQRYRLMAAAYEMTTRSYRNVSLPQVRIRSAPV